jgi:AcrR family transcriptional regulator
MPEQRPRRRQARGMQRIEQILAAAAEVFAEVGYEAATTNAIAARAQMSPGSLYQFFPHKDAIAQALATRYVDELALTQESAFSADLAYVTLDELLDQVVDPLVRFNIANPGFQVLFADSAVPRQVASAPVQLHDAVLGRVEAMIAARAPDLPREQRIRVARVSVQVFRAILPLVLSSSPEEQEAIVGELKNVLRGYLAPLTGEPRPSGPATSA